MKGRSALGAIATTVMLAILAASCARVDVNVELLRAAEEGNARQVKALLAKGARVDAKDSFDRTALMLSAVGGYPEVTAALIEAGADVHAKAKYGQTALRFALDRGDNVIADMLKAAGADS
jgi:ankyrin repeat protein